MILWEIREVHHLAVTIGESMKQAAS